MHENETVRDLLEAALRKLEDLRDDPPANESNTLSPTTPSHPGLERFTIIESDSTPAIPKPCFMEPARPCVKSGACEMRGY